MPSSILALSISKAELRESINAAGASVKRIGSKTKTAIYTALGELTGEMVSEIKARAPVGKFNTFHAPGNLRDNGFGVRGEVREGSITFRITLKVPYALIQDKGGTIVPRNSKALFIPLKNGVYPIKNKKARKAAGFVKGEDFVLASHVTIKGSRYISGTIADFKQGIVPALGSRVAELLRR